MEILVIRNTVTEPVERVGKIAAAKQAKVDSLRAVLPHETFGWCC